MEKRLLKPKEISVRIGTIKKSGLSLLLYIDSRAAQNLLDEKFGEFGWKRTHQLINNDLYCSISVWDERKNQWIERQDVGTESYTEKEKSRASDSFKRACVNWGIGRELYSAPFIWIPDSEVNIRETKDSNGKVRYKCDDLFYVNRIKYNNLDEIDMLQIIRKKKDGTDMKRVHVTFPEKKITPEMIKTLEDAFASLGEKTKKDVFDTCSIESVEQMSVIDYKGIYGSLKKMVEDKCMSPVA